MEIIIRQFLTTKQRKIKKDQDLFNLHPTYIYFTAYTNMYGNYIEI